MPAGDEEPNGFAVPTCAGCGAMCRPGTCPAGCAEHKLLLARASTVAALTQAQTSILRSVAALRTPLDELANGTVPAVEWEAAYDDLRARARAGLETAVDERIVTFLLDTPAEPVVAWWCNRCGGVDAPQPCLGICVWHSVDWTPYDTYARLRERVIAAYEMYRRERSLVWRLVHTTPRRGQHSQTWLAYAAAAAELVVATETVVQDL